MQCIFFHINSSMHANSTGYNKCKYCVVHSYPIIKSYIISASSVYYSHGWTMGWLLWVFWRNLLVITALCIGICRGDDIISAYNCPVRIFDNLKVAIYTPRLCHAIQSFSSWNALHPANHLLNDVFQSCLYSLGIDASGGLVINIPVFVASGCLL